MTAENEKSPYWVQFFPTEHLISTGKHYMLYSEVSGNLKVVDEYGEKAHIEEALEELQESLMLEELDFEERDLTDEERTVLDCIKLVYPSAKYTVQAYYKASAGKVWDYLKDVFWDADKKKEAKEAKKKRKLELEEYFSRHQDQLTKIKNKSIDNKEPFLRALEAALSSGVENKDIESLVDLVLLDDDFLKSLDLSGDDKNLKEVIKKLKKDPMMHVAIKHFGDDLPVEAPVDMVRSKLVERLKEKGVQTNKIDFIGIESDPKEDRLAMMQMKPEVALQIIKAFKLEYSDLAKDLY